MLLFFTGALAASQTNISLWLAGYTSEAVHHAPRSRAYKTLHVLATAALTAGTAAVQVFKNGISAGSVILDSGAHRGRDSITLAVEPGDRIEMKVTTSSDFAPTPAVLALIQ